MKINLPYIIGFQSRDIQDIQIRGSYVISRNSELIEMLQGMIMFLNVIKMSL